MPSFPDRLSPAEPSGPETLSKERNQSDVPVKKLARHLLDASFLDRQEKIEKELQKEKLLSKHTQLNLARPDRYKLGLARAKLLRRMAKRLNWTAEDSHMAEYLLDDFSPYHLQMSMFITTIREQASDEQRAHWLPLIEQWKIHGCYAQSELGHGSNVRGLELEARYDCQRKEFVLHSPTLTASKWWNGSMGRTSTHAIVVAQLMLPDSNASSGFSSKGPHPFIVQIRDLKTHQPLAGIAVGDIGPKYGYAPMDNGYMLFDQHRIPHSAFLSRYFEVDPDTGSYSSKAKSPAVVYGSLTKIRVDIVMHARLVLARAVTVAMRYLTIRRQFKDRDDGGSQKLETAVLDYPTVQIRVLPLLATTFALHYTGKAMGVHYAATRKDIERNDFSSLADMHAHSSGLKSICTSFAADGIEICRRAMGGHGFHSGSGLIQLNNDYLSKPTVEGDNWMITQQTSSYLIKRMDAIANASSTGDVIKDTNIASRILTEYLAANFPRKLRESDAFPILTNDKTIVQAFERRAAFLTHQAYKKRMEEKKSWTSMMIQLHHLSNAFSQMLMVRNFYDALFPSTSSSNIPSAAHAVMRTCFRLFSLHALSTSQPHDFLRCHAISNSSLDALPDLMLELMAELRPHAVNLADAWSIPDYLLDSALGRYDGRVYEDLFDRAHRLNPLNEVTFNPYYWNEEIIIGKPESKEEVERLVSLSNGKASKL